MLGKVGKPALIEGLSLGSRPGALTFVRLLEHQQRPVGAGLRAFADAHHFHAQGWPSWVVAAITLVVKTSRRAVSGSRLKLHQ
jgi:hypothetical protein